MIYNNFMQVLNPGRLTSQKTGKLLSIAVTGDSNASGTRVSTHGSEWQKLTTILSDLLIHPQQALGIVGALHLTSP